MDEIALRTLGREMLDDCRVANEAFIKARDRCARGDEVGYEACAHHLSRMFNGIEQMGLRVAKAFENNIDDEQGWHTGLLKRLGLEITGVRPALLPAELKLPLHESKGFRHLIVHAYELELDRRSYNCSSAMRRGWRRNWSLSRSNSSARSPTSKA